MDLTNSKRLLYSANHVATVLTEEDQQAGADQPEGALRKLSFVRALKLQPADIRAVRARLQHTERVQMEPLINVMSHLDKMHHLDAAAELAIIPSKQFINFAELVRATKPTSASGNISALLEAFKQQQKVSPVGRLHLERLEMYAVGVEKGELVFTVPMAPGETVTVSHKEWSTTSQEYEQIVQDSFESYSEKGVAEKTDASMSAENEAKHSDRLNFGATLSGGYGPVSLTTTFGLENSNDERQSVKNSIQQNKEVTEKASARARQEHKVSIKLETKKGVEDSSFRTISNPSNVARRIDYYKMMRKWRTDLYRYGLRMTYDLAIPTPGVRLWARWQRIAELEKELRVPFVFTLKPQDITVINHLAEGLKVGVLSLPELPDEQVKQSLANTIGPISEDDRHAVGYFKFEFDVPAGYEFLAATATAHINRWIGEEWKFRWYSGITKFQIAPPATLNEAIGDLNHFKGATGHLMAVCMYQTILSAALVLDITYTRTHAAYLDWRSRVWDAIHAAAQAAYQEKMSRLQAEHDQLYRSLIDKDTLSLRRLEREEMIRLIMQWLFGPGSDYSNSPASIQATIDKLLTNEVKFQSGTLVNASESPTFTGVSSGDSSEALLFGELVKFLQQAVEWENLLYIPYPYFWGSENQGRAKFLFKHFDPEHERFLRAGYMRVVLTIRPGFEEDFTRLVETGSLGNQTTFKLLTAAEEIASFARTNYSGIPPANPEKHARPLLYPQQRKTWAIMESVIELIEKFRADNGKYPDTLADLPGAATEDAWGNPLVYIVPGSGNDYDLISHGANGEPGGEEQSPLNADISSAAGASLVATWFEYTPTSGIDIEVDTKPEDIA